MLVETRARDEHAKKAGTYSAPAFFFLASRFQDCGETDAEWTPDSVDSRAPESPAVGQKELLLTLIQISIGNPAYPRRPR